MKWLLLIIGFPEWGSYSFAVYDKVFNSIPLTIQDEFNGLGAWITIVGFVILCKLDQIRQNKE